VLLEDNTAEICSYRAIGANPFKAERTALTIPAELDGYQVTGIGEHAFDDYLPLSITIPRSVTCIETRPFSGCPATLTITVDRDSYAAGWCRESSLNYTYTDSLDWLTN
jgi:hypothetical protein